MPKSRKKRSPRLISTLTSSPQPKTKQIMKLQKIKVKLTTGLLYENQLALAERKFHLWREVDFEEFEEEVKVEESKLGQSAVVGVV